MSATNVSNINQVIALCRPGFENDCANELMYFANKHLFNAYIKAKPNTGYVQLIITGGTDNNSNALTFINTVKFYQLIFVRQWFASSSELTVLPEQDRVTAITAIIKEFGLTFKNIELSYADTNDGKTLSKFAKQFLPHLERGLKKLIRNKSEQNLNIIFYRFNAYLYRF